MNITREPTSINSFLSFVEHVMEFNQSEDSLSEFIRYGHWLRNLTAHHPSLNESAGGVVHVPRRTLPSASVWLRDPRIPLYSIIFLLSVLGNTMVIVTLVQNKRMWTITNAFLLNLSASDLLLTVFCAPFTLIPTLMQNFVFGKAMCILARYSQGKRREGGGQYSVATSR